MALFTALLGSIQISATKQYKDPSLYVINSELSVSKIFYKLSSFNLTNYDQACFDKAIPEIIISVINTNLLLHFIINNPKFERNAFFE